MNVSPLLSSPSCQPAGAEILPSLMIVPPPNHVASAMSLPDSVIVPESVTLIKNEEKLLIATLLAPSLKLEASAPKASDENVPDSVAAEKSTVPFCMDQLPQA